MSKKNRWMKKSCVVAVALVTLFVIGGCGSKTDNLQPQEWILDGKVVSYYDSGEDIGEESCQKYTSYISAIMSDSKNMVVTNKDKEIRAFITEDSTVETYKGISVGDAASVVEDTFLYEEAYGESSYTVYFDGITEMDTESQEPEDDWILLSYFLEDGIIERITVFDSFFGKMMR